MLQNLYEMLSCESMTDTRLLAKVVDDDDEEMAAKAYHHFYCD